MQANDLCTSRVGLLRVAGLPGRLWTSAGNPELFDELRRHTKEKTNYATFAKTLADRLGIEIIPHPELSKNERAKLLTLRRQLHNASPIAEIQRDGLASKINDLNPKLADDLIHAVSLSIALRTKEKALISKVEAEHLRLAELPWKLVTSSTIATRAINEAAPELLDEIKQRLANGETWTSKRLRHRSDYLLRLLARGTVKTTPRGWFAHVALAQISESSDEWPTVGPYAANWIANIETGRQTLTNNNELTTATVTITGLHWVNDGRLYCWVVDPKDLTKLRQVVVKCTSALDAIRQALSSGGRNAEDLVCEILPPEASESQREVLRGFVRHLVGLGILQLSALPENRFTDWKELTEETKFPDQKGYTDVYRKVTGSIPQEAVILLEESVSHATRLGAVFAQERTRIEHPILKLLNSTPRLVTEILAEFLREEDEKTQTQQTEDRAIPQTGWPQPNLDQDTPYTRLLAWLAAEPQASAKQVTITAKILNEIAAPPAEPLAWPVNCLIRPITGTAGLEAMLESLSPAGIMNARFAEALSHLHGELPQVEEYRVFLQELAQHCDAECVEMLVPPLSDLGANTVRRPRYISKWTGDADLVTYRPMIEGDTYLPLDQITVRRMGDRIIAEDMSGKALWPMYHATRVPLAPWNAAVTLLMAASPIRNLLPLLPPRDPIAAFPGRNYFPRLVLDGGLVLSPAQWLLTRKQVPATDLPLVERAQALADFRSSNGLPRWVFVHAAGRSRPRPLDLDSLAALRSLDKLLNEPKVSELIVEEMLPDPEHFALHDADGEMLAAQLLVSLPNQEKPSELANRAASRERIFRQKFSVLS